MRFTSLLAFFFTTALALTAVSAQSLDEKILNIFFHNIIDSLTQTGGGFDPIFNPSATYLEMALNGIPINPDQFNNLISVQNLNGTATQSEYFSRLVNSNGLVTGVDQIYTNILHSAFALDDSDPTRKALHDRAFNYLWVNETHVNYFTGEVESDGFVPTPIYQLYIDKQGDYINQLANYRRFVNSFDLSDVAQQREYFIEEPAMNNNVQVAYRRFRSVASNVEDALAALNTLGQSLAKTIIDENKSVLDQSQRPSLVLGSAAHYHMSYATPYDFATNDNYYSQFTVTSKEDHVSSSSSYSSWGAKGGFSGFWGFGFDASAGGSTNRTQRHSDATFIKITGKITLVRVDRPWLWDSLFAVGGWNIPLSPRGSVSQGNPSSTQTQQLPSYPTHLIVAKDLHLNGDFSQGDFRFYNQHNQASARVTFGPFTLAGGNYDSQTTTQTFTGTNTTDTFIVPGLQILGWVNKIIPFSPQLDG